MLIGQEGMALVHTLRFLFSRFLHYKTYVLRTNKSPLQLELAEMKRRDKDCPTCPFNLQEIGAIVREKAGPIGFTDEGDIGYLVHRLYEIHTSDPMWQ